MVRPTRTSCIICSFLLLMVISAIFFTFRPQTAQGAKDSCPLSAKQKVRAVKAFKGLAPIFKEPRCLNCHGAVNPFSRTGGHGGGYIDIRKETGEFLKMPDLQNSLTGVGDDPDGTFTAKIIAGLKEIAESPSEITDNDLIRQKAFDPMRETCKQCHIFPWIIPRRHNYFVGRSAKDMCIHIKSSSDTDTPVSFLRHMQDDELILEGFKGRRGLLEPVPPEPPTISFATVEKYANEWVEAMGGKFHKPPDCGCTAEGIVLEVHHRIKADPPPQSNIGQALFDGAVRFEVLLEPYAEGWFRGEIDMVRPLVVGHVRPAAHQCSGSGSQLEHWLVTAQVDPKSESMTVQFGYITSNEQASWICSGPAGTFTDDLMVELFGSLESVQMSTKTGTKKDVNGRNINFLEWLSVMVVEGLD